MLAGLVVLAGIWAQPAAAQVTVDLRALDALPPPPIPLAGPTRPMPVRPSSVRPTPAHAPQAHAPQAEAAPQRSARVASAPVASAPVASAPVTSTPPVITARTDVPAASQPAPMPSMPAAPPVGAAMPPPATATPPATPAAPPPAPISIGFAHDATDLSNADIARLKAMAAATPEGPAVSFDVTAYASGSPEDPSSARRLSLSRGLAVRAALVAAGVPSTRIYVRAMGLGTGPGAHDRADVSVHGLPVSGAPPA